MKKPRNCWEYDDNNTFPSSKLFFCRCQKRGKIHERNHFNKNISERESTMKKDLRTKKESNEGEALFKMKTVNERKKRRCMIRREEGRTKGRVGKKGEKGEKG